MVQLVFSSPVITSSDEFCQVVLDDSTGVTTQQGRPMIQKTTKTFEFPWGSTITGFSSISSGLKTQQIDSHIQPVPTYTTVGINVVEDSSYLDEAIYSTDAVYPSSWCEYTTGAGINSNGERVLFVNVHMNPVRYQVKDLVILGLLVFH